MSLNILIRKARVALTPKNCLLKTTLSDGATICGRNRPGYGGRGIHIFRDTIEPEIQHLLDFLTPGGVLVDIGANTGIYTLKDGRYLAANGGTVISLEPFPEMLAMLQHNVRLNGLNNVRLRNFCAGDHTLAAAFWQNFDKPNSLSLIRQDEEAASFSVLVVALDDLFEWEGVNRLDYLKMIDAEGAEELILQGASRTIEKFRPIIQLEILLVDSHASFPGYTAFQASTGSTNRLLIPNESPKLTVPQTLGWKKV